MVVVSTQFTCAGEPAAFDVATFREALLVQFSSAYDVRASLSAGSVLLDVRILASAAAIATAVEAALTGTLPAEMSSRWFGGNVTVESITPPIRSVELVSAPSPPQGLGSNASNATNATAAAVPPPDGANATTPGEFITFEDGQMKVEIDGATLSLPIWGWAVAFAVAVALLAICICIVCRCCCTDALQKSRESRQLVNGSSRAESERSGRRGLPKGWSADQLNSSTQPNLSHQNSAPRLEHQATAPRLHHQATAPRLVQHQPPRPRMYERMPTSMLPRSMSGFRSGIEQSLAASAKPSARDFQMIPSPSSGGRHHRTETHESNQAMVTGRI